MKATIIKIGTSRGVRLRKIYMGKIGVIEGDSLEVVIKKTEANSARAIETLRNLAHGGIKSIKEPAAWQRRQRNWREPWKRGKR